jgi:Ca2+-binding RTX toxin-like protein
MVHAESLGRLLRVAVLTLFLSLAAAAPSAVAEPPLPAEEAITSSLAQAYQEHQQQLQLHAEQLASPESVAERERSKQAYADLGKADAEGLLRSVFGPILDSLDRDPARFLSDAKVDKVAGEGAATVTSEGDTQLLETSIPVQVEDASGEVGKVDLALVETGGAWEPENPLVELAIGDSADEGVELGDEGLTITQVGADETAARPLGDKNLFFPEVDAGTDIDQIVAPVSSGVEIFDLLRSADSPESLRFHLDLPAGSQLRAGPSGTAEVVDAEGRASALIPKPWAVDAQETQVPVEMTVEGDEIVLGVQHGEGDFAYPILVDPTIYQDWGWWYQGQHLSGLGAWRWQQSSGAWWVNHGYEDTGFPGYEGKGLFIATAPGTLQGQQWGQWIYSAPPGSYLASATINPFWRNNRQCAPSSYYYPYDYAGTWIESSGWHQLNFNNANDLGYSNLNQWGESVIIGMSTDANTNTYMPCWRDLMIGGVGIWLDDWQIPWMTILAPPPSNWVKRDATARTVEIKGTDEGLGVQRIRMYAGSKEWNWDQPFCAGTYEDRCATERTGKISYTTESVGAEGKVNIGFQVIDPTDKRGTVERTLMVDGTAPTLSLSGEAGSTSYKLNVEAKDGSTTEPRSGVKEVKVYLDGSLKETRVSSCTSSGCPSTVAFSYTQNHAGLGLGKHTLEVLATDQVGYTKTSSTTFTVEAPNTIIDSGPEGLTNDSTPTFTYHSTHEGSTFSCSVDGGAYVGCPSTGYTTPVLTAGNHTFSVRATNAAGFTDASPATRTFTVDATPPETTIESGPAATTRDPKPEFTYSSNESPPRFECRFDKAPFASCPNGRYEASAALADGTHTFNVRAVDAAGNIDPTPASRTFTVDSSPPAVEIQSGPAGPTNDSTPTFTFSAAGGTPECSIEADTTGGDDPSYGGCSTTTSYTPVVPLGDGAYTFRVRVLDGAENEGSDARSFSIDTTAPQTTVDSGPTGTTDDTKPSFGFSASEPGSTFQCRFDLESFGPCSGPGATHVPPAALANGTHTFYVRAIDPAGNVDSSPASRAFVVSTAGPQTYILGGPNGGTSNASPTFTYFADETATFECALDGTAFLPCSSGGYTATNLSDGEHRFEVRGKNGAGVVDPTPAMRTFVVDTSAPPAPSASGEMRDSSRPGLELNLEANDDNPPNPNTVRSGIKAIRISVDGQLVETLEAECSSSLCPAIEVRDVELPYKKAVGFHQLKIEAEDGVGHVSPAVTWVESTPEAGTVVGFTTEPQRPNDCDKPKRLRYPKNEEVVRGTPGSDLIISRPGVEVIHGRGGCDVIVGNRSQEKIFGEGDADTIRGGRSNDWIYGEGGADVLYGGIGDDHLYGQDADDILDGSPGADLLFGGDQDDTLRGGAGEDQMTGGQNTDTVSYADAISATFVKDGSVANFNGFPGAEPGVNIDLGAALPTADNGIVGVGGGVDALYIMKRSEIKKGPGQAGIKAGGSFERVIGSAFNDRIRGTTGAETIEGGPGADALLGNGGNDTLNGGLGDDYVEGEPQKSLNGRPDGKIEIGVQRPDGGGAETDFFLAGTTGVDEVRVRATQGSVQFIGLNGAAARFVPAHPEGCGELKTNTINCPLAGGTLGAVVASGGGNHDVLNLEGERRDGKGAFILEGGSGDDTLTGGKIEDLVVDGEVQEAGVEHLRGGAGDDSVFQGSGADELQGGPGNDLLISAQICGGDEIYGAKPNPKQSDANWLDNAQFHPLKNNGVFIDLENHQLGVARAKPACDEAKDFDNVAQIEDVEASQQADVIRGDGGGNLLIGRGGADSIYGRGGNDSLNALDEQRDTIVNCGGPQAGDHAHVDLNGRPNDRGILRQCGTGPAHIDEKGDIHRARLGEGYDNSFDESPSPALPPPPPLRSYFPLNDQEGTKAVNLGESTREGTYKAAGVGPSVNGPGPKLGVPGGLREDVDDDPAVEFDGVDDYVDLNGEGAPEAEAPGYTVEMLTKFGRAPGATEYLFAATEGTGGAYLYRNEQGKLVFTTAIRNGAPRVVSPEAVADEKWHYVVGTLEGERINLFVDGFHYQTGFGESVVRGNGGGVVESFAGVGPNVKQFFKGTIDELAVHADTTPESEVFSLMAATLAEEPEKLLAPNPEPDTDGDGVEDGADNCPETANADQADTDLDGLGDACEPPDSDGDDVVDSSDDCPETYNPEQTDSDGNGIGDACTASPPGASTEAATQVKATSATLNATIDPAGQNTTYQFEYGKTTAYGTKIPFTPKSVGSGATAVAVQQAISGLEQGTTYHFRVVAVNPSGETEGEDRTFTTLRLPVATTGSATSIKPTSAILNGTVTPNGSTTTYQFEYGKTTAYGSKAPVTPKSAGSGTTAVAVSQSISGLDPSTTYHFRLVASSEAGISNGKDATFATPALPVGSEQLTAMPVTQPFDGTPASVASFAERWSQLGWAASSAYGKGEDSVGGWHPVEAFSSVAGAYYEPVLTDTGSGLAAVATMTTNPSIESRYFSLWVDLSNPAAAARSGYELRFTDVAANTYNVTLSRWQGGTQTVLATQANYSFVDGNSFALVDQGGTVSAWTNTGTAFGQLLSAADGTYSAGRTGVEASGNITRLANFKAGVPLPKAASMDAALKSLPVNDSFGTSENPLSGGGAWAALAWDTSASGHNTGWVSNGWGPYDAYSTVNGAYWQKWTSADNGAGDAVSARLTSSPSGLSRYFSLWLNAPSPGSAKSGYELRFTYVSTNTYEVTLSKWVSGAKTVLGTAANYSFPTENELALVKKGGTVSAWTNTGSDFTQLLSAADTSFYDGYAAVEGSGNFTRIMDFSSGPLRPF